MEQPKRIDSFKEVEGKGFLFTKVLRTGRQYIFSCPKCSIENMVSFDNIGIRKCYCKQCNVKLTASVKEPKLKEEPPSQNKKDNTPSQQEANKDRPGVNEEKGGAKQERHDEHQNTGTPTKNTTTDDSHFKKKSHAALVYGGRFGFFGKKTTKRLHFGSNVIGRYDPDALSDINIDDEYVSRRSVEITVSKIPGGKGEIYRMSLLRQPKNPVTVNSKELTMESGVINLNYNDKIKLGHTVMTLKRIN